jgi:hypothetical protein
MMPSGTSKPLAFSVQTVRWFSQFFRDCGFRRKMDSDSDARRTLIPTEAGQ